jgi:hypothetical protein
MRFMKSVMAIAAVAAALMTMTGIRRRKKNRGGTKGHGMLGRRHG